jgi:hypothetical protein
VLSSNWQEQHAGRTLACSRLPGWLNMAERTGVCVLVFSLCIILCICSCVQVWDTETGEELHTLEGHKNVVSS